MTTAASTRPRVKKIAARLGTVAAAATVLVGVNAGMANAAMQYSGDFSWRATAVKRLANCAASDWYNNSRSGAKITTCDGAGSSSYWDGLHLTAASVHTINGRKVAYRSDQSCPPKRGFQYVKCWYVGGKTKGNPVITVSILTNGSGGLDTAVDWYYL
ncbi:hypothetical protein [Streptomyces sp. NPDC047042]|uniref:hypothetical protein n=1 Tax=Streptomyces sp. NPDC047042 TaxID=3154807 RepID=UPI0033EF8C51